MITITDHRFNGEHHESTRVVDPIRALDSLVKYELGFGGQIIEASPPTKLVVRTRILACVDTTTFEGTEEDMRYLFDAALYFSMAVARYDNETREKVADKLIEITGGNPLLVTSLAPLLIGRHRVRISMLLACGITDPEELNAGLELPDDDLVAVISLRLENPNMSIQEIVETVSA